MNRDTPADALRGVVWTARCTWWASLLTAAAALVPLIAASAHLTPCLLGAINLRPTGGAGAPDASGDAISGAFMCPWSWQTLLCRPLAELATWLQLAGGARGDSPTVLLLAIPTVTALLLGGLGIVRAAGLSAQTVARTHVGAREIARRSLSASHAAPRRVATLMGVAGLRGGQVRVLDDARSFASTYGLWRPLVALSTGLIERLDDAALVAVLTHEAAHVRQRDPLRRLLSRALRYACPQAPMLRTLEEHLHLRQEIEADADAAVVAGGAAPIARALVSLVTNTGRQHMPAYLPTVQRREQSERGEECEECEECEEYETGDLGDTAEVRAGTRMSQMSHGRSRLAGAWGLHGREMPAYVQTGELHWGLRRRVDVLLGRVQAADFLAPSAVVVVSVFGIAAYWCLLAW